MFDAYWTLLYGLSSSFDAYWTLLYGLSSSFDFLCSRIFLAEFIYTPGTCTSRVHVHFFFMHFCPGTMTTHAESTNSDLQRGLGRHLRHTQQNRTR